MSLCMREMPGIIFGKQEPNYRLWIWTEELLKKASAELVEAHKAQTSVLQNEAEGDSVPMTVLFSHAQDTLMTVESEQYMISILYQCLKNMKKGEK